MPTPEIGWRLHPSYWRRGRATEAAKAALEQGVTALGFSEVVSIYEPESVASGRVTERIAMTLDRDTKHPRSVPPLGVHRFHRDAWKRQRRHTSETVETDSPASRSRPGQPRSAPPPSRYRLARAITARRASAANPGSHKLDGHPGHAKGPRDDYLGGAGIVVVLKS